MAVFSVVTVLAIFTSSPKADTFNLFDIALMIGGSFIVGYSWLVCGSDHEESEQNP